MSFLLLARPLSDMTLLSQTLLIGATFLAPCAYAMNKSGFVREKCYKRILEDITHGSLPLNHPAFFRDSFGRPMSDSGNLTLTLDGCKMLCGDRRAWYDDIGPRLSAWLIPILLLVSNVELSPLDKRRFYAILHLLGDPIDSIWSLVHKIYSWDRCYRLASRYSSVCQRCQHVIGTVFGGFEELQGPRTISEDDFDAFCKLHPFPLYSQQWRRAAVKLADNRTNEFARTCLAISLYVYQLIAGFVKEVGGDSSSPPGGRIATSVFLSWLVPTTLLSNAIGNFPSRRTCYDVFSAFELETGGEVKVSHRESVLMPGLRPLAHESLTEYFQSLSWSGGIYTFRPWKCESDMRKGHWPCEGFNLLLSIIPMCIGMTGGFLILWNLIPNGFNCRHTWLIGIFLAWFASAFITWLSNSPHFATGKYHWHFVLVKDALIAIPTFTIIFLSACGLFNSCFCWSGYLHYGEHAHVAMDTESFFEHNDHTIYPLIVGVCLALQLLFFGSIMYIWRNGMSLLRWSESTRSREWQLVQENANCDCLTEYEF